MNTHNMEYNSQKEVLEMNEYGRNIHMMVQHAKTIEDREYRQAFIEKVIMLMHQMQPQNRSIEDYRAKLWKHVFRIADYDLDVTPYDGEVPTKKDKYKKPAGMDYPEISTRFRHYGHNVQKLIQKALQMEDGPVKDGFVSAIGSYMKLAFRTWNREHFVSDEAIIADLESYSKGKLKLAEGSTFNNFASTITNSGGGGKRDGRKRGKDSGYSRDKNNRKGGHKKGGGSNRRRN
jgi:uncharacterized protein DUF4290